MSKHHAKHKSHHENSTKEEAGFLSFDFKKFMTRRDKFFAAGLIIGVAILLAAAIYIIIGGRAVDEEAEEEMRAVERQNEVNAQIDEMTSNVKDTTVLVNPRTINPNSVTITAGGSVGFFNEEAQAVELRGYDGASEILNIGEVAPYDVAVVVFDTPGTYRYVNPNNPADIAEVIVE